MAKHTGLVLSSLVATALTFSATSRADITDLWNPAHHVSHMFDLAAALDGVDLYAWQNGLPQSNRWAGTSEACAITWADDAMNPPSALTKGSCFLTLAIRKANPAITSSTMFAWWGSSSPSAPKYYDMIAAEKRFWSLDTVADIDTGDVLAVKYNTTSGYTLVVVTIEPQPELWDNNTPMDPSDDLARYTLQVVDSTTTPHHDQDSRWQKDPATSNTHDQGVGTGFLFLTVDPTTGGIAGHSWSDQDLNQSDYYPNNATGRPMLAGRFDANKLDGQ